MGHEVKEPSNTGIDSVKTVHAQTANISKAGLKTRLQADHPIACGSTLTSAPFSNPIYGKFDRETP